MTFWDKTLVALGLKEKPRRRPWIFSTIGPEGLRMTRKLKRLMQVDDVWYQHYTDDLGREVSYEWRWWGYDDGWHLHKWKIEESDDHHD